MSRVKAGALNQRIRIEAETQTRDMTSGAVNRAWTTFADSVPAEVVPVSGREFLQSGARQGEAMTRITIRHLPGVLDTMRIVLGGVTYAIRAVLPDPSFRDHLTIMASSGVSGGE
jgi:SPP1 family predicted phage head-tail adaptor